MTEAEAGRSAAPKPGTELEARLAAALDLLQRARRALARADLAALERLAPMLQGLPGELGRWSGTDRRGPGRILALLDEAGALSEALHAERARLEVQLRAAGAYRRAGAAYRRASRL